ncbi:hypothetical protein [Hydrogenophaga sp.]|uniref:hypothetical protein n=1 Tax=Hydrogenophaga sp. TaxID=1904254 RepID=UPI0025C50AAC|nr:hypothetical protein [Hydrogenophaga sp.]
MTFFDPLLHLAGFLAPAMGVAVLLWLALLLRRGQRKSGGRPGRELAWLFVAGVAVLLAGLVYFGRDGKMATYAGLVFVQGTLAWRLRGR